ncbi:MAG: AAA family ATPase [bacterium]|nr:AAA family ATPase [bacterium]
MDQLTPEEVAIIREEEANLKRLLTLSSADRFDDAREKYLAQIIELREALDEAKSDDVAHLTEQINTLIQLVNQSELADAYGFNPLNPYFARLVLEEERTRDLYIGTQVFSNKEAGVQIIDWKASPIAVIYFRYLQGDEYEEEIGGRLSEGVVAVKRMLKVEEGELVRIEDHQVHLFKDPLEGWQQGHHRHYLLKGGSGQATRAERARTAKSGMGAGHKLLPEITALIDPDQFDLITKPSTGILAIQGTAGSGKTTVALHRVAWLHRKDPKRFAADKMMVVVFNRALAYYISLVLPSLGVKGVEIAVFETWAADIKRKLYGNLLPKEVSEETPAVAIRFKKHPALLNLIDRYLIEKKLALEEGLSQITVTKNLDEQLSQILESKSFVDQLIWLRDACGPEPKQTATFPYSGEVKAMVWNLVEPMVGDLFGNKRRLVVQLWDEFFSDFERLRKAFERDAADEFSPAQLDEAISWLRGQYIARHNWWGAKEQGKAEAGEADLDLEDDSILLYFWAHLAGPLEAPERGPLAFNHLFVDEAQDLSLIEHRVLLSAAAEPTSLTYAGDVNQQMIQNNSFKGWKYLFESLGLPGQEVSNLRVSYRATHQIMEFAMQVLGDLASTKDFKAVKEGPGVDLFQFAHQGELCRNLAQSLNDLSLEEPNASIALICADAKAAKDYYQTLEKMEIPNLRLVDDQNFSFTAGIDVTDLRQVKGLEFDYVILMDVDVINYPDNSYSRYLLHIGATRAAHQLWLLNYRVPSEILPAELIERAIR